VTHDVHQQAHEHSKLSEFEQNPLQCSQVDTQASLSSSHRKLAAKFPALHGLSPYLLGMFITTITDFIRLIKGGWSLFT